MNKYTLTEESKQVGSKTLYRIKALKDFGTVKEGDLGGFIESEKNLSQEGNCWVGGNAWVSRDAWVSRNAQVLGDARVYGNVWISEEAWVFGNAQVFGDAVVCGDAWVYGNAKVFGDAWVCGYAKVLEDVDSEPEPENLEVIDLSARETIRDLCGIIERLNQRIYKLEQKETK